MSTWSDYAAELVGYPQVERLHRLAVLRLEIVGHCHDGRIVSVERLNEVLDVLTLSSIDRKLLMEDITSHLLVAGRAAIK